MVAQPEISFVAITTGPTNLVAQAVCRDSADLYRFLTQEIAGLSGVNALETTPVLRTVKELHMMRQT